MGRADLSQAHSLQNGKPRETMSDDELTIYTFATNALAGGDPIIAMFERGPGHRLCRVCGAEWSEARPAEHVGGCPLSKRVRLTDAPSSILLTHTFAIAARVHGEDDQPGPQEVSSSNSVRVASGPGGPNPGPHPWSPMHLRVWPVLHRCRCLDDFVARICNLFGVRRMSLQHNVFCPTRLLWSTRSSGAN